MEPGRVSSWREIPVDELRRFLAELVEDTNLREAGRLIGRGREQVRKFISGDIETPHPSTREAIARLYVQRHGFAPGTMRASEVRVSTPSRTPLKLILPQPLERATAEIRTFFEKVGHLPDAPEWASTLERWLLTHVRDEYATEVPYPRPRQRRRKKDGREG